MIALPLKRETAGGRGASAFVREDTGRRESLHRASSSADYELRSCVNTISDVVMQLVPELYERNKEKHAEIIMQQPGRLRELLSARISE